MTIELWNNDIIGFTETQTKPSDSTFTIIEKPNLFNNNFDNNENKFLNLVYQYGNDVVV